jgi:plastocyanin
VLRGISPLTGRAGEEHTANLSALTTDLMKIALGIIIALIVIGGGYFFFAHKTQAPVQNPAIQEGSTSAALETTNPNAPADVTVTYTDSGYSPKTVTVPVGTTVTFVNNSSHGMWTASAMHPSHTAYDGTTLQQHCATHSSFDECSAAGAGATYSFTFTKAGTFGYHNHVQANDTGTVVVQ